MKHGFRGTYVLGCRCVPCSQANSRYQVKWQRRRVVEFQFKSQPCQDCNGEFPPECMDFDHVRGIKVMSVSDMIRKGFKKETVLKEIAKCDLVCANCHRIRTFKEVRANMPLDKVAEK